MAKTILGLDIGSWSIKVAVFESSLRNFTLVDTIEQPIPRGPGGAASDETATDHVRLALRELLDWDSIGSAASGKRVMTREVELPFSDDRRIQSVLDFQLEGLLPVDLDDLVTDYIQTETTEEGSRLLCVSVEKDWLGDYLGSLEAAEAAPRTVTLNALAHGALLRQGDQAPTADQESQETVAVVDLGHETTTVSVMVGGRCRTVRSIGRGGHHLTQALARATDSDYAQAERLKHSSVRLDGHVPHGQSEEESLRLAAILQGSLETIVRDVRLTLHAHANRWGAPVDRVLLCGGTSRIPGLEELMTHALGVQTRMWRVGDAEWCQSTMTPESAAGMTTAIALGIGQVEGGAGDQVNFRKGEFAYESDYKVLKDRAAWFLTMAFLLLSAFVGRQYMTYQGLKENHAVLVEQLQNFSEEVLGEPKEDFEHVLARLQKPPAAEAASVFPTMSAFRAFFDMTTAQEVINQTPPAESAGDEPAPVRVSTPEGETAEDEESEEKDKDEGYQVELKQIQVDLKSGYIKGEANNIEAVEAYTGELKKNECFIEVETNDTTRISFGERKDWLRFQLKVDIDCEEGKAAKKEAEATKKKSEETSAVSDDTEEGSP